MDSTGEGSQLPWGKEPERVSERPSSHQPYSWVSVFRKGQWRGQDVLCVQETWAFLTRRDTGTQP